MNLADEIDVQGFSAEEEELEEISTKRRKNSRITSQYIQTVIDDGGKLSPLSANYMLSGLFNVLKVCDKTIIELIIESICF